MAACTSPPDLARPLAVDWRPEDRADLEVAMKRGVAVVSYDCKEARVLRDCHVEGGYGFVGINTKEQVIRLRGADELRLNLPFFGAKLEARAKREAAFDVALAMIGQSVSTRPMLAKSQLTGDCKGATHFVRAATVGAFVMRTATSGEIGAAAQLLSTGASGTSSSASDVMNRDGDPSACRKASGDAKTPERQCSSLLRLELKAISADPVVEAPDPFVEYATARACPEGSVSVDGKCARPEAGKRHVCEYGDKKGCERECQAGDAASCARLGLMHERGEGASRDDGAAAAAYEKACGAGDVPACSRLGTALILSGDAKRGLELSHKACQSGWANACRNVFLYYQKHPGSDVDLLPLTERGCAGGDADSCSSVGFLHAQGIGLPKDAERSVHFFKKGCTGGSLGGCLLLGDAYASGEGATKDASRALELYMLVCAAKKGAGCSAASKFYFTGEGVEKNDAKGIELLDRACGFGDAGACTVLGMRYQLGTNVPRDQQKSETYYRRGCDGGVQPACERLQKK